MKNPQCSDATGDVVETQEPETSESANSLNYRCPVCRKMVDATSAEEILLHHEHVTHPRDFLFLFPKPLAA